MAHVPVLLQEIVDLLKPQVGEVLLDATVNRGGHSAALCLLLGETGRVVGIDQDGAAVGEAQANLAICPGKVQVVQANFRDLDQVLREQGVGAADIILFDLGLSSNQLDESGRGFSFQRDEPLQMTFHEQPGKATVTAEEIVNYWSPEQLAEILTGYGEEQFALQIARGICDARRRGVITRTSELVEIVKRSVPRWYSSPARRTHCATKTFQALRMATNDELDALATGLEKAFSVLAPSGRLAVISFHSLEARIVKNFFKNKKSVGVAELVTKHAVKPSRAEILANRRSRSAQLRVLRKI